MIKAVAKYQYFHMGVWLSYRQLEADVWAGKDVSGTRGHPSQPGNYRRWSDTAPLNHLGSLRKGSNCARENEPVSLIC